LDRAEITQIISKVARRGKVIWKDGGAELIVYRSISSGLFLIQAYSEALDQAGRRAPLLCCGEFDGLDNAPKQILEATTAIKNFANEIGRSVDPSHALSFDGPAFRNRLQQWVEGLKKASSNASRDRSWDGCVRDAVDIGGLEANQPIGAQHTEPAIAIDGRASFSEVKI
jgi:hypothetical protein